MHTETGRALTWANPARLVRYYALIKFTGVYACFSRVLHMYTNNNRHFIISVSHSVHPSVFLSLFLPPPLSLFAFLRVWLTCRRNVGRASVVLLSRGYYRRFLFPSVPCRSFVLSFLSLPLCLSLSRALCFFCHRVYLSVVPGFLFFPL